MLKAAPVLTCLACSVEMIVRELEKLSTDNYTAMYRCPKCFTETRREFTVPPVA